MAQRFQNADRNTPLLLPPDLREWVAEDDLVHFVIAAVERLSLDGTHLKASASKDKNLTYERAQQLRAQLKADVARLLEQAEAADQREEDPQRLPAEIARREKLLAKMEAACAQLEARAKARAEAERTEYERKL